jgi:diguanylate cyclase (GGDEF)-like protein
MAKLEPLRSNIETPGRRKKCLYVLIISYVLMSISAVLCPNICMSLFGNKSSMIYEVIAAGCLSQIQLFISVEMVLHFSAEGYFSSLILNLIHIFLLLLIIILDHRYYFIAGIFIYVMAIFLTVVIYRRMRLFNQNVEQLHRMASTDELTNLANRQRMISLIDGLISGSGAISAFTVVFIDLDNFKLINDSLGHQIGDIFLREVVHNFSTVIEDGDMLGRMGGDEFLLVSPGVRTAQSLNAYLSRLIKAVAIPFRVKDRTYTCTASFGIARYPQDGDTVTALLKQSDMAMYQAKTSGKNRGVIFDEKMQKVVSRRVQLEQNLRLAIGNGDLSLEYQPQFAVPSINLRGFEVLLRWDSPLYGRIAPSEFIPIAEENGTIIEMTRWMFARAFTEYEKVIRTYETPPVLSVNISVVQFRDENLITELADLLQKTKMDPHNLEIEITESVFIKSPEAASEVMKKLRSMGIKIALDDFGTEYSSLKYLRILPLDTVKIDKSFVDPLSSDSSSENIVHTIVEMAHQLGLKVVAEGVQNVDQLEALISYKCDYIQGYYLGKPLPAAGL